MVFMMIQIGYLTANIDGDARYTDYLRVYFNPAAGDVSIKVSETVAAGGMDGPGGSTQERVTFDELIPEPTAQKVLATVRQLCRSSSYNFARYGKATKRFVWQGVDNETLGKGLAVSLAEKALNAAKESS